MEGIKKMRNLVYELDKQIDSLENSLKKANKDGEVVEIVNPSAEKSQESKDQSPNEEVEESLIEIDNYVNYNQNSNKI
uniref:Uncharacterized protein n=1 Tax=Acrobeloides nanus TaxID=290746 RepID=A0A914DYV8_9BILA